MIVPSMTKEDLFREDSYDSEWVRGMTMNQVKKHQKKLGKLKTNSCTVLSVTNYKSPRKNDLVVVWYGVKYPDVGTAISCIIYYKYWTPRGFQYVEVVHNKYSREIIVFTSHAIDRLKERSNIAFNEYIVQDVNDTVSPNFYMSDYEYNGKTSKALLFKDTGMFILEEGDWGLYAVTYINKEQQGETQNELNTNRDNTEDKFNLCFMYDLKKSLSKRVRHEV